MKENHILVAVVTPGVRVRLAWIENTTKAVLETIECKRFECFPVNLYDDSIVGVCDDEGLLVGKPFAGYNYATDAWIAGTFIVAGDRDTDDGRVFCSLTRAQLLDVGYLFGLAENPELMDTQPPCATEP